MVECRLTRNASRRKEIRLRSSSESWNYRVEDQLFILYVDCTPYSTSTLTYPFLCSDPKKQTRQPGRGLRDQDSVTGQ